MKLSASASAGGARAKFQKLEFPSAKDDIETFIIEGFLRDVPKNVFSYEGRTATKNSEADLDFTLTCSDGQPRKIDLMEIALLEDVQGSYDAAPASNRPHDTAEKVLGNIMGKSKKYGSAGATELSLLTYTTDWKFTVSESVLTLLQYWTATNSHNFAGIYLYMLIDNSSGVSRLIYPTPLEFWKDFDPETLRGHKTINFDPKKWQSGRGED